MGKSGCERGLNLCCGLTAKDCCGGFCFNGIYSDGQVIPLCDIPVWTGMIETKGTENEKDPACKRQRWLDKQLSDFVRLHVLANHHAGIFSL